MGLFGSSTDRLISALLAENSDLRLQLRLERTHWTDERNKLLDRIQSLTSPERSHSHFPGSRPNTRPPSPFSPPSAPESPRLSDAERAAVLTSLGIPKGGGPDLG
jgi:hypothetical protein